MLVPNRSSEATRTVKSTVHLVQHGLEWTLFPKAAVETDMTSECSLVGSDLVYLTASLHTITRRAECAKVHCAYDSLAKT